MYMVLFVAAARRHVVQLSDNAAAEDVLEGLSQNSGFDEKLGKLKRETRKDSAEMQVSSRREFVLRPACAQKIGTQRRAYIQRG